MQEITISLSFNIKITNIKKDGFIGILKKNGKAVIVKDKIALTNIPYIEGEDVIVKITTITPEMFEEDVKGKKFYCAINELTNNGFYTKEYKERENKFKQAFWYDARGMITIPDDNMERYEVGDLLMIEVKNG